jgi:hypothetical protein
MELTWKASEPACALYAATCLSAGLPAADARFVESFSPALDTAIAEFVACDVPADRLLPIMTGLAARGVDDNRQLVEQAITKIAGSRSAWMASAGRLAGVVGGLKAAFQSTYRSLAADSRPLADELALRSRPLVAAWEARCRALLLQLARSTEENVLASTAEIAIIFPVVGGHGIAHRSLNAVTFEAGRKDADPQLPEIVRLPWLLAQLNLDLPMYADHIAPAHRDAVGQWALVPAVLAAAEHVELGTLTTKSIGRALTTWRLADDSAVDDITGHSATLLTWWKTYQDSRTSWAVALGALEQMLFTGANQP